MEEDEEGLIRRKLIAYPTAFIFTGATFGRPGLWAAEKTRVVVNNVYVETVKNAAEEAENAVLKAPSALALPAAVLGLKKGAVKGVIRGLSKGIMKKVPW